MHESEELKGVEIMQVFPVLSIDGKLRQYDTMQVQVYYYKDMCLYHLYYLFDSSELEPKFEKRDHFVAYKKADKYGFDYNRFKKQNARKVKLDSLFTFEWVVQNDLYAAFKNLNAKLLSHISNKDSGTLHEVYEFKDKEGVTRSTGFYSFSHESMQFEVSLSRQLDSLKNMKLFKARQVNNRYYMQKYKLFIDAFESSYGLKEIPVTNKKEILSYFTRFMEDARKLKMNDP